MNEFTRTMVILDHKGIKVAHNESTGSDNVIVNDDEFNLQVGQKVKVKQRKGMYVEILEIK